MNLFKKTFIFVICIMSLFLFPQVATNAMTVNLKVAFNANFPPYQFIDEDGVIKGMHIDFLNAIAKDNGYKIEYVPLDNNKDCIEELENGNVDIILGILMDNSSPYYTQLTNSISSSALCMIAPNKKAEIMETQENLIDTISYEYGTVNYSLLSSLKASQYLAVGNQRTVFEHQRSGKTEVMVGIKGSLLYQMEQAGVIEDYTILRNYMSTVEHGILVQKGDYELLRDLNTGIGQLHTSSDYEAIYNKWIIHDDYSAASQLMKKIGIISSAAGIVVIIYISISSYLSSILKKQVMVKTQEIRVTNQELKKRISQVEYESNLRNLIIEYSPAAMILLDKEFRIIVLNLAAAMLVEDNIGVGSEIRESKIFEEVLKEKENEIFKPSYSLKNQILTITSLEGARRRYRCNIHPTIEDGIVNGVLLTLEDVTREEKEKQTEFEKEKNKSLNRIIAGIAHEIRNPLLSIRTFASLIRTKRNDEKFQNAFSENVTTEVDRINSLVESLINYAKPPMQKTECLNVKTVINECMYLTSAMMKKDRMLLETDIKEELNFEANKNQIKQILINLFLNSITAMEKKISGMEKPLERPLVLLISAWDEGEVINISVRDEGVGMNKDELKRCTEHFFTTKPQGTGLGLSLLRVYVDDNHGSLKIESKENEYTLITISFKKL